MTDLRKTVAIVGVDESDEIGKVPDKSNLRHHAGAAYNALEDAGMSIKDVNGLFTAGTSTLNLAEYLGIEPSFTDTTAVGGSSFIIHIAHAMAAINAGYCDVALVTHGEAGRSRRSRPGGDAADPGSQFETPYGFLGAPINYAFNGFTLDLGVQLRQGLPRASLLLERRSLPQIREGGETPGPQDSINFVFARIAKNLDNETDVRAPGPLVVRRHFHQTSDGI